MVQVRSLVLAVVLAIPCARIFFSIDHNIGSASLRLHATSIKKDEATNASKASQNQQISASGQLQHVELVQKGTHATNGKEDSYTQELMKEWGRLWKTRFSDDFDDNNSLTIKSNNISLDERRRIFQLTADSNTSETSNIWKVLQATFPTPKQRLSIAVYNEHAYNELISSLLELKDNGRNFTLVANGGSTTAGGGIPAVPQDDRYYSRFADGLNRLLNRTVDDPKVQWIGQGHGERSSLHSAVLFDNFIPLNTDLLLWEFSINDAAGANIESIKLSFLSWMHEVSRMEHRPKVILIYYWDSAFRHQSDTGNIVGRSFEYTKHIAWQFDFVVGHVNMASYVDELGLPECWEYNECPLVSDHHHASKLGHLATAYLLLYMMGPDRSWVSRKEDNLTKVETDFYWSCGNETKAKQALERVITNSSSGWKSSLGGWTMEQPVYKQRTPRNFVLGREMGDFEMLGKQDIVRQDRQRCTPLGYCASNSTASFSVVATNEPMKDVTVILLSFRSRYPLLDTTDMNVRLNGSNVTTNGELVPMQVFKAKGIGKQWPCHFSSTRAWGSRVDLYWYIFEQPQPIVSSVALCIPPESARTHPVKIQSMAFW